MPSIPTPLCLGGSSWHKWAREKSKTFQEKGRDKIIMFTVENVADSEIPWWVRGRSHKPKHLAIPHQTASWWSPPTTYRHLPQHKNPSSKCTNMCAGRRNLHEEIFSTLTRDVKLQRQKEAILPTFSSRKVQRWKDVTFNTDCWGAWGTGTFQKHAGGNVTSCGRSG